MFAVPCLIYLTVAWALVFVFASFDGDAQSRVANAYYVLFSRDPHLAALGFVWNPLPSLIVLPLLPLKALWPALTARAFIGNIGSAIFMAGAGYQIHGFCRDLGVRRAVRLTLVAAFALNPMIVYYGANGMSEGLFLLTLAVATRYLTRWLSTDRTGPLVVAASALGLAYLTREEAVFAAVSASLLVFVVASRRATGGTRQRLETAFLDTSIFAVPFAVCFIAWATVSWVIVGHPFEQFSSIYGNASQLQLGEASSRLANSAGHALLHSVAATFFLTPLLPIVVLLTLRRRSGRPYDFRALAPFAVTGGVLIFEIGAHMFGKTFPWLRYQIVSIPLLVMLAACLSVRVERSRPIPADGPRRRVSTRLALAAIIGAAALSAPSSAWAMSQPSVGPEEWLHLGYVFHPNARDPLQARDEHLYRSVVGIARYFDAMHLPHGAILVDTFTPCMPFIILASAHPQQFLITTDRDFERALDAPDVFAVKYLMVPPPVDLGHLDALNRKYRSLYKDGAGVGTQVRQFDLRGCPHFRLFQVLDFTA